jgi:chromatin remodeling complex protein RSC6
MKGMAKTSKKKKRTPSAAVMKPVTPDEKLAKVVGDKPLPRTELTKKLWALSARLMEGRQFHASGMGQGHG